MTGAGRLAWGLPHFGPNLQMLLLGLSNYQNLWNLLVLVKIIEIDRQHAPTPRLCSSRAKGVDKDS